MEAEDIEVDKSLILCSYNPIVDSLVISSPGCILLRDIGTRSFHNETKEERFKVSTRHRWLLWEFQTHQALQ